MMIIYDNINLCIIITHYHTHNIHNSVPKTHYSSNQQRHLYHYYILFKYISHRKKYQVMEACEIFIDINNNKSEEDKVHDE